MSQEECYHAIRDKIIQYCHSSKATSHEFGHKTPKDNLATVTAAYGVTKNAQYA